SGAKDRDALQERDLLRRVPIAQDGKADRLSPFPAHEIGVAPVAEGRVMARLVPAPHQGVVSRAAFARHDEGNHRWIGAGALDLRRQAPPAQMMRSTGRQRRSAMVKRKAAGTAIPATTTNLTAAGQGAGARAYCSATTIGRWTR